jgi:hypothetical protein
VDFAGPIDVDDANAVVSTIDVVGSVIIPVVVVIVVVVDDDALLATSSITSSICDRVPAAAAAAAVGVVVVVDGCGGGCDTVCLSPVRFDDETMFDTIVIKSFCCVGAVEILVVVTTCLVC